jgi:prepilin-type N-terminal cleavage/methylation domain-containing protein/prepilin-type processing-associated H-X9-DG protein
MWGRRDGFTLMELLVVVVIIGFTLAMLLPALARSKTKAQGLFCMNNLKQLQIAWGMYAEDHQDWLPGVIGGSMAGPGRWVSGWLDFSSNQANTNTLYLTEARYAQLGPYVARMVGAFHCPADQSTVRIQGRSHDRVRSMSLNCWMNYAGSSEIGQDRYLIFRKYGQIQEPSPSKAWVFIDEREDSINDGLFQTNLKSRGRQAKIVDYPASYHNRAAGLSFADGHTEIKRWLDRRTTPDLKTGQLIVLDVTSPYNQDVAWLQDHATAARPDK